MKIKEKINKKHFPYSDIITIYLAKLSNICYSLYFDDLSLLDICNLDQRFNDLIESFCELKNDLVDDAKDRSF